MTYSGVSKGSLGSVLVEVQPVNILYNKANTKFNYGLICQMFGILGMNPSLMLMSSKSENYLHETVCVHL